MSTISGPQTPSGSQSATAPLQTPPPTVTAAPKRKSSELDSEAPDSSVGAGAERPAKIRKLRKHHVLAFVNEDDSSDDEPASVAEDGTHIKQEPEEPAVPTPVSALSAQVAAKLDAMRITKTHILAGIRARILAFQGTQASCREAEADLDEARRRLDSFDALIEEVRELDEGLRKPRMEKLFLGGRERRARGVRRPAMELLRLEVAEKLEKMEGVREGKLEVWRRSYRKVKEWRRELGRLSAILDRRWEALDAWRVKMQALERLETALGSEVVVELLA